MLNNPQDDKNVTRNGWFTWKKKVSIASISSAGDNSKNNNKDNAANPVANDSVEAERQFKAMGATTSAPPLAQEDGFGEPSVAAIVNEQLSERRNNSSTSLNKAWSFWSNKTSTASEDDTKKVITEVIRSNTLYSEEWDFTDKPLEPNFSCSTTDIQTHNIIIPSFLESIPKNSYYNHFRSLVSQISSKAGYGSESTDKSHLLRNTYPDTSFKKILIIGVHGFFPTKYLRPFIGEPTGTSMKFMSEAENTIRQWVNENRSHFGNNSKLLVSKIALEKEGKVFDRVNYFYDVLSRYDLNQYDFIYVAAHSQGTPVSIILMAKLIEMGLISELHRKRLGILAMAGISIGPFYGVNKKIFVRAYSTIESDSMLELFEFQNFNSVQSLKYLESLKILLSNNAKIVYIGSINDQLVPLYSSTCIHIQHPNIFRSIYIDKDSNTPNFLIKILNCSLLLHNMGLNDHGMIKEISNALAGPLTGGGHSKIYNEYKVYELGLNFFLYSTTNKKYEEIAIRRKEFVIDTLGINPFHLPWCLRGLMYESICNIKNGEKYVNLMLQEFDEWDPSTKVLKDIKYRLNAIKAKL